MDPRVERAMQQWPNVPDIYGWLSLDRRGRWLLRGEPISNPNLIDFINRNYLRLDDGSYVFQNGPQRVHVDLHATPWVALAQLQDGQLTLHNHCGQSITELDQIAISPQGDVLFILRQQPALLRDQDLSEILHNLRDEQGQNLQEQALTDWLSGDSDLPLTFQFNQQLIAVQRAPNPEHWPEYFGFIAHPAKNKPHGA